MANPSLKQIEYALAVARCGSFRGAAEELGVSQPTLTAQIARLRVLAWRPGSPSRGFYRELAKELRRIIAAQLGHVVQVIDASKSSS